MRSRITRCRWPSWRMLQGLGRLIRHRTDRGVLAVLDPRLRTMGYGRRFLDSFPPAPVTQDLAAIDAVFSQADLKSRDEYVNHDDK